MAENNVNHIHNLIYFFTPPDQKAPTANPDRPNLFNILSAATDLVKDNLFNDNKQGFKFKTSEDSQVEALRDWDTGSIDKNNTQNQDNYLKAIIKIMKKDDGFIRKCSDSGVSEERIDVIKKFKPLEYDKLEEKIMGKSLTISPLNIKLKSKPKDVYTEGDVAGIAYKELQNAQSRESKPDNSLKKVKDGVKGVGKGTFNAFRRVGVAIGGGAISAGEAAVRVFDGDPNVNSWRVMDSKDTYDGTYVLTDKIHLKPTLFEKFGRRAGPASTTYNQSDARNHRDNGLGYKNSSTYVRSLLERAKRDEKELKDFHGPSAGRVMFEDGRSPPRGRGR
jgi:hypothetical protein